MKSDRSRASWFASALAVFVATWLASASVASDNEVDDRPRELRTEDLEALSWRSVGPANMSGRVAALAMAPSDPKTFYIGYATGGVWKTTNAGTTFSPVFDKYETSSIGSIVVCDAPPEWAGWEDEEPDDETDRAQAGRGRIVWVGTGEGNGRNSSSWGHGVYRSTDGGGSFEHRGLADSHDIPAIAVDPRDPDVAYVAALGHLWGPNEMRGVYKTVDGGATWDKVLFIDEDTGAIDVLIDPENPETVYAAMYMRRRSAWSFQSGGETGGIFRSLDAGRTWEQLTEGLPEQTGRIGLDIFDGDPRILYAVVESNEGGWFRSSFNNFQREGGVFRTDDGGDTWTRVNDFNPRSFYFSEIRVDPTDDQRIYLLGWTVYYSNDGGKTFRPGGAKVTHVDQHAMVINPNDTDHLILGNDGGAYVSHDRGKTWDHLDHMAVGQFYNVAVDDGDPYRVGGGLQDNGSWIGPSETLRNASGNGGRAGGITNRDWEPVWYGDGFHVAFDPLDPNIIYAEMQGGGIGRVHLDTGQRFQLKPSPKEGEPRFRFNWNAPFFISPHDPTTLYFAGNYVFKFTERGDRWERISDDLSRREVDKIMSVGSQAETYGTVVALAESRLQPGLLWAGTDDGRIHVTMNDGETWTDVTPDEVNGYYVSEIEPSDHDRDTAYASVDGHRSDYFGPILLMTTDAGATWTSIAGDLPDDAAIQVVKEDHRNPDVLYVGTERAAYVTIDRGERWVKLNGASLPTVPVDDLVIQRREQDLVAGTHGRSIWILDDISPLSQLTPEVLEKTLHVFEPMPAKPRYRMMYGALYSDRMFVAKNPPMGAVISYWLREYPGEDVKVSIKDGDGATLVSLTGGNRPGINRVVWDLQPEQKLRLGTPHGEPEFVAPGEYTVTVTCGEEQAATTLTVLPAPASENPRE